MNTRRLEELDGLRGVAALAVVLYHYTYRYNEIYGHSFQVPDWANLGRYGVHLFFLVSGFVIFWTLSRTNRPFDFVWSRFSRLYPVYWSALSITFVAVFLFGLSGRETRFYDFIANFLMFHEYLSFKHVDGVYWSLTLELTFYFWMFTLFIFKQIKNIEKWLLIWIILSIIFFYGEFDLKLDSRIKKLFLFDFIAFFSAGICFFKLWQGEAKKITYLVLLSSIFLLFVQAPKEAWGLTCLYLIFYLTISGRLKFLAWPLFIFLGTISYPLYLIHQNIGQIIINYAYQYGFSPIFGIYSAIVLSLLLAYLLNYFVEKPSIKYLREHYKSNVRMQRIANNFLVFSNR